MTYTKDKKETLQVRLPSWMKAKLLDAMPAREVSEFVRQAIEEKLRRIQETTDVTNS